MISQEAIDQMFAEAHARRISFDLETCTEAEREAYWAALLSTPEEAQQ